MPLSLESLTQQALILPAAERVALAFRILSSVDPAIEPEAEAAWDAELAARIDRFDRGDSKGIEAEEVFARLRKIAPTE